MATLAAIVKAITAAKERKGSSLQAIQKAVALPDNKAASVCAL